MGDVATMRLVGGHPALDFVNTLGGRPSDPDDEYLHNYADLLGWSHRTGLLPPQAHRPLIDIADDSPSQAQRSLTSATRMRAALDATLRARLEDRPPSPADLDTLRRCYISALRHAELQPDSHGCTWAFPHSEHHHLDLPGWTIAIEAIKVLNHPHLDRLGQCEHCRWLYLDTTRNHTRRWCSMNACGATNKMRRHRARNARTQGASAGLCK